MSIKSLEQIYFAAPFDTLEQQIFNARIVRLLRTYNFPVFFPQEHHEELDDETFYMLCMEALNQSHLVLAIFYGETFTAQTAFEIGYARGRRHTVIGLRNNLTIENQPFNEDSFSEFSFLKRSCVRIIDAFEKDEDLLNPLISTLNRYFGSYQLYI